MEILEITGMVTERKNGFVRAHWYTQQAKESIGELEDGSKDIAQTETQNGLK